MWWILTGIMGILGLVFTVGTVVAVIMCERGSLFAAAAFFAFGLAMLGGAYWIYANVIK